MFSTQLCAYVFFARKAAASATSSTRPRRPIGMRAARSSLFSIASRGLYISATELYEWHLAMHLQEGRDVRTGTRGGVTFRHISLNIARQDNVCADSEPSHFPGQ